MKRFLFLFLTFSTSTITANFFQVTPESFMLKQYMHCCTTCFEIEMEGEEVGIVERKKHSYDISYKVKDLYKETRAVASVNFSCDKAVINFVDSDTQEMATMKDGLKKPCTSRTIFSSSGKALVKANLNCSGTELAVTNARTGDLIATLSRPALRVKDDWCVEIVDPLFFEDHQLSPDFLILLAAYQSDRELWDAQDMLSDLQDFIGFL